MDTINSTERARLRALFEKATAGEWRADGTHVSPAYETEALRPAYIVAKGENAKANIGFIAAAHAAVPALLEAVDLAQGAAVEYARIAQEAREERDAMAERVVAVVRLLGQVNGICPEAVENAIQMISHPDWAGEGAADETELPVGGEDQAQSLAPR